MGSKGGVESAIGTGVEPVSLQVEEGEMEEIEDDDVGVLGLIRSKRKAYGRRSACVVHEGKGGKSRKDVSKEE